jgi:hypothetical protein
MVIRKPTWEAEFSILYFQHLQNRTEKMSVHALQTVHALPDLHVAAGRLRDGSRSTSKQSQNSTSILSAF